MQKEEVPATGYFLIHHLTFQLRFPPLTDAPHGALGLKSHPAGVNAPGHNVAPHGARELNNAWSPR